MDAKISTKFIDDLIEYLGQEKFDAGKTVVRAMPRWISKEYNIEIVLFQDQTYCFQCFVKGKWYSGHALTIAHAARESIYSIQRKSNR